ncbi:MAG: glycosyltransferase family 2 protein [Candidatus Entotheonellia bacterium]
MNRDASPGVGAATRISIIVPAYNNSRELVECLTALIASADQWSEIIVVDDASTDDTPAVAVQMGARVVRLEKNSGPAAARNYGVHHAIGAILFFVDADVVVSPEAVGHVVDVLDKRPDLAAVFGSYDAYPRARGLISQYRNLLHHFVHQQGNSEASTFWAGCGAIRRAVFEEVGGFDEQRYVKPSIEDIELGLRLRQAGYRILLDKSLQAKHLKKWTLRSVIKTDIACRAIPWSRLILESGKAPDDLNLAGAQRLSGALVGLAVALLPLTVVRLEVLAISLGALLSVGVLNRHLYGFFSHQRGLLFASACIPLHLLYYLYSGSSYVYVWLDFHLKGAGRDQARPVAGGKRS